MIISDADARFILNVLDSMPTLVSEIRTRTPDGMIVKRWVEDAGERAAKGADILRERLGISALGLDSPVLEEPPLKCICGRETNLLRSFEMVYMGLRIFITEGVHEKGHCREVASVPFIPEFRRAVEATRAS